MRYSIGAAVGGFIGGLCGAASRNIAMVALGAAMGAFIGISVAATDD